MIDDGTGLLAAGGQARATGPARLATDDGADDGAARATPSAREERSAPVAAAPEADTGR
ncbi:hypothetical protein ACFQ9Z_21365 [Streptomyces sp. NPDC056580]|uniref:hypothetical protein n=1 Tax=Streptomyces sp. NPDC056580 TaxID=3345872 RepID=UPI0036AAEB86